MDFESDIKNISLEGFQVVKSKFFSRPSEPVMSLFPSAISFNTAAHKALNGCEYIEVLLNEKKKSILVRPASGSADNESVRWQCGKGKPKYMRVECTAFTRPIFSVWKLNPKYHYKAVGKVVQCDKKVMLLFDFNDCETFEGLKMVK